MHLFNIKRCVSVQCLNISGEALDDMEQTPTTVGECQMAKLLSERGMKPGSPVGGWTVDDVTQWLKKIGLQDYEQTFRDNAIDGTELLTLDTQTISEDLGISETHCKTNGENGQTDRQTDR
jgi:hypothetical protein